MPSRKRCPKGKRRSNVNCVKKSRGKSRSKSRSKSRKSRSRKVGSYIAFVKKVSKYIQGLPRDQKSKVVSVLYHNSKGHEIPINLRPFVDMAQGFLDASPELAQIMETYLARLRPTEKDLIIRDAYNRIGEFRGFCRDSKPPCPRYCNKRKNSCVTRDKLGLAQDGLNIAGALQAGRPVPPRQPFHLKRPDCSVLRKPNCAPFCRPGRADRCAQFPLRQLRKAVGANLREAHLNGLI